MFFKKLIEKTQKIMNGPVYKNQKRKPDGSDYTLWCYYCGTQMKHKENAAFCPYCGNIMHPLD